MALFEDSDQDEIRRLRALIAKLEETKNVRTVTVEMVPRKDQPGWLFYICAPSSVNEEVFGKAMGETILRSFKVLGANMRKEFVGGNHIVPPKEAKTVKEIGPDCYIAESLLGRWIIISAEYRALAWSGSRWVPHNHGFPAGNVQVSNFESKLEACRVADEAGLRVLTSGYKATKRDITCYRCGLTSRSPYDVIQKYCGNCHVFHDKTTIEE